MNPKAINYDKKGVYKLFRLLIIPSTYENNQLLRKPSIDFSRKYR